MVDLSVYYSISNRLSNNAFSVLNGIKSELMSDI